MNKNELLVSIIKKSLESFNLNLVSYSEEDAKFESKNKDYSIVYKIVKEENQSRLYFEFHSDLLISIFQIEEFSFKFDREIEEKKLKIKSIEIILDNVQRFKNFVSKIFKSVYKGDN